MLSGIVLVGLQGVVKAYLSYGCLVGLIGSLGVLELQLYNDLEENNLSLPFT